MMNSLRRPFPANNFLKQTTIRGANRGKKPFLFHYVREEEKLNRVKYAQYYYKQNVGIKPFP